MATPIHTILVDYTYVSQIFMLQELTTVSVVTPSSLGDRNANSGEKEGGSKKKVHHGAVRFDRARKIV